jgi:hypothetical protein
VKAPVLLDIGGGIMNDTSRSVFTGILNVSVGAPADTDSIVVAVPDVNLGVLA